MLILLAVVDPEVVIELNDRAVVDVMEACFADSSALISVCVNVCFCVNIDRVGFCGQFAIYGVVEVLSLLMLSDSFCRVLSVSGAKPVI